MFKILMKGKNMKITKKNLNEALKVLGKVVSQTSPVEVQKSIRFVGDANGVTAMATDGIEVISLKVEAFTEHEIDFCVPFKDLKDMIRFERSEMLDIDGVHLDYPQIKQPTEEPHISVSLTTGGSWKESPHKIICRPPKGRLVHPSGAY